MIVCAHFVIAAGAFAEAGVLSPVPTPFADPAAAKRQASNYFAQGYDAWKAGNLDIARDFFERGLALDPRNADALFYAGEVARAKRDFAGAKGYYERSLAADPDGRNAIAAQGALASLAEQGKAMEVFAQAFDAEKAGNLAEAKRLYEDGLKRSDDAQARARLGAVNKGLAEQEAVRGKLLRERSANLANAVRPRLLAALEDTIVPASVVEAVLGRPDLAEAPSFAFSSLKYRTTSGATGEATYSDLGGGVNTIEWKVGDVVGRGVYFLGDMVPIYSEARISLGRVFKRDLIEIEIAGNLYPVKGGNEFRIRTTHKLHWRDAFGIDNDSNLLRVEFACTIGSAPASRQTHGGTRLEALPVACVPKHCQDDLLPPGGGGNWSYWQCNAWSAERRFDWVPSVGIMTASLADWIAFKTRP